MLLNTKGILLRAIPYGDTSIVAHIYTADFGLRAFMLKGLRKKKGKQNHLQALYQLELSFYKNNKGNLYLVKDIQITQPYTSIPGNIYKSAVALFLNEMLDKTLKEEEKNEGLYEFISQALMWLDKSERFQNFHLSFLLLLSKYLGFQPDDCYDEAHQIFDLKEGSFFTSVQSSQSLSPIISNYIHQLFNANFEASSHITIQHEHRNLLLKSMVTYYQIHGNMTREIKSLEVLQSTFGD